MRIRTFTAAQPGGLRRRATRPARPAHADDTPPRSTIVTVTATRLPTDRRRCAGRPRHRRGRDRGPQAAGLAADILTTVPGRQPHSRGRLRRRHLGAHPRRLARQDPGADRRRAGERPGHADGAFDFSGLDLADIDRIEVLSGPQGSLWGSSAIGGVIAFTTREARRPGGRASRAARSAAGARLGSAAGAASDDHALSAAVSASAPTASRQADAADGNTEDDGFETWTSGR